MSVWFRPSPALGRARALALALVLSLALALLNLSPAAAKLPPGSAPAISSASALSSAGVSAGAPGPRTVRRLFTPISALNGRLRSSAAVRIPEYAGGRGPERGFVPVGDVVVPVGALDQALLDAYPEGTRFVLAAGVHRLAHPLMPRPAQQLLGHYGAVLSGSKLLLDWRFSGGAWVVEGQSQRLPLKDTGGQRVCELSSPLCVRGEDVFLDDRPLVQVASRAELAPGRFFFDYAADRIWIVDDPRGARLEATQASAAVVSGAGVLLRNLVVEKFGNPYQSGAVSGVDLVISHCLVRLNHGGGVFNYGGSISRSVVSDNGQLGLGGGGAGQFVVDNEIAGNNWAGFDPGWEAGGTKFAFSERLVVRDNWVHHNLGNGLWTDIDNLDTLYERNRVEDNSGVGIFHEISGSALIRNNVVRRNGSRDATFNGQVGINVTNSFGVEVLDNVVEDNVGGPVLLVQDSRSGVGALGLRELRRVRVAGNLMRGGGYRGVWVYDDVPDRASYFFSRELVFESNLYQVPDVADRVFLGGDARLGRDWEKTWAMWRALGADGGSSLS